MALFDFFHVNTLTCLPQSSSSWDYIVTDSARRKSAVIINPFSEQGSIVHDGVEYLIVKEGWFRNRWLLNSSSQCIAQIAASGLTQRRFQILTAGREYGLRPRNLATRHFDIYATPTPIGWLAPTHAFSRQTTIECTNEMPVLMQILCLWLAVITWRRITPFWPFP